MPLVQKISFKSNSSNLLKNATEKHVSGGVEPQPQQIAPVQPKVENRIKPDNKSSSKKLAYIGANIAILSLSITGVLAVKHGKLSEQMREMSKKSNDLLNELSSKVIKDVENKFSYLSGDVQKRINALNERVTGLGKWQDGQIAGVKKDLSEKISKIITPVKSSGMNEILVSPVEVNGLQLNLATTMNGYGKHTEELEKSLRSESAKRIFGIADRSSIVVPDELMIRVPTSEFTGLAKTGGMAIVPKEVVANLGGIINNKQNARLIVDMPLYLGQVEEKVYYSIQKQANGKFSYVSSAMQKPMAEDIELIDRMQLPIYTDKGKSTEFVDVFMSRNHKQVIDLDLLMPWLEKDLANEIQLAIKKGTPFEINHNILTVKYSPEDGIMKPTAQIKYDTVFYKNDKFRMDGPVVDGQTKNIYNNLTHESGETERFIYFDKFFYENLLRNAETSNERLRADLIIGNDWQTGGISAMMKLLTTAKRHFGLDPKVADKLYNTPVMTIIHNAGLSGNVWHSQEKLLNVMFGEHASMITKNAWMPKGASLNAESLNGLFNGNNLNPQTMAAVYSDVLTPVAKGYGNEMASHSGFGGANHDIFRMRARYHEYNDIEHLKYIARQNDLDPKLIPQKNMGYRPITNGCDRVNNVLTESKARKIEKYVGLENGSLRLRRPGENVAEWHNHNKEVYLNKVISEVDMARTGKGNPMNIELAEMTNLQGVTKDTMVVSTAGRIVDQKGLDIFAESIEEFLSRHQGENLPVFYAQGVGDKVYIDKLLDVKRKVAEKYGQNAANRIVFARLFSEPGRYDGCKLMSDFTVMSSWFEPCGLVHKEIAAFSGAIPVVNKVGGLVDGLSDGVNAIFAEFKNKFDNYFDAIRFNRKHFADALDKAFELFKDKKRFADVLTKSYETDHSWLKVGGPMEEYANIFVDYKVLKPEVLQHS